MFYIRSSNNLKTSVLQSSRSDFRPKKVEREFKMSFWMILSFSMRTMMILKYIMLRRCIKSAGSSLFGKESSAMTLNTYGEIDFFMSFYLVVSSSSSLKNYLAILSAMIKLDTCSAVLFDLTVKSKSWSEHSYKFDLWELRLSTSFLRSPLLLSSVLTN